MSASIALSDFCRKPRASHGTISEVAGTPMPRTEGAMLEHCCCRIGSKCFAKEVKSTLSGSSHILIQPQPRPRLWQNVFPHLHVSREISAMNTNPKSLLGLSDRGYARLF
jgi:hypothetical protein